MVKSIQIPIELKDVYTKTTYNVQSSKSWKRPIVEMGAKVLLSATLLTIGISEKAFAASKGADEIRAGFQDILDIFTAIAEPILWFYALTACILIATKSRQAGIERLKQVAYAYAGIALLPTFFALLRFVADMVKGSISL